MRTVTERVFTDLFIIALAAKGDLATNHMGMSMTVGSFTKVLVFMKIMRPGAERRLVDNRDLQNYFRRHVEVAPSFTHHEVLMARAERPLIIRQNPGKEVDRRRLLSNTMIMISNKGFRHALEKEGEYADVFAPEQFLAARQERAEEFQRLPEAARIAILKRARLREEAERILDSEESPSA